MAGASEGMDMETLFTELVGNCPCLLSPSSVLLLLRLLLEAVSETVYVMRTECVIDL